jgi:hypothetical protein
MASYRTKAPITILDVTGNALTFALNAAQATIYLRNADGSPSATPATVYTTENGGTTASQPLQADVAGRLQGWLPRGRYVATCSATGLTTYNEPFDAGTNVDDDRIDFTVGHLGVGLAADATDPLVVGSSNTLRYTVAGQFQLPATGSTGGLLVGGDTNLYRGAADQLKTDDLLVAESVTLKLKAGTPADADFTNTSVPNGAVAIDTTGPTLYARIAGSWTAIAGGGGGGPPTGPAGGVLGGTYANPTFDTTRLDLTAGGQFQVTTTGSAAGIVLGGDAQIYRGAAGALWVSTTGAGLSQLVISGAAAQNAVLTFNDAATAYWNLTSSGSTHNLILLDLQHGSRQSALFSQAGDVTFCATDGGIGRGKVGIRNTSASAVFNVDNVGDTTSGTLSAAKVAHTMSGFSTGGTAPDLGALAVSLIVGPTVDLASGFDIAARGIKSVVTVNNPSQVHGASVIGIGSSIGITATSSVNNEFAYALFSSADNTASGAVHPRMWGMDSAVHGYAGNEQNDVLFNISAYINNHFNGSPTRGKSIGVAVHTMFGGGPGGHATTQTYPVDIGLHVGGTSGTASAGTGLGFTVGVQAGGEGNPWSYPLTTTATKLGTAGYFLDWGQYGVRIGRRYAGAAESGPVALLIENDGMNVKGSNTIDHSTATTEGTTFLFNTAPTAAVQQLINLGTGQSIAMGAGATRLTGINIGFTATVAGTVTSTSIQAFNFAPTIDLADATGAKLGATMQGYRHAPSIRLPTSGGTTAHGSVVSTEWRPFTDETSYSFNTTHGTDTATVVSHSSFRSIVTVDSGWTVTTLRGMRILAPGGSGTITTLIGVDVEDLNAFAGTKTNTPISLRSLGTVPVMQHAGPVKIGATGTPAAGKALDVTGDILLSDGATISLAATTTGLKIGASGDKLGFYSVTPVARPSAYTQTYATADKTLGAYTANAQSSAYTGAADGEAKLADLNALRVAYENLRGFTEDLAQQHNSVIDDFQAVGLLA